MFGNTCAPQIMLFSIGNEGRSAEQTTLHIASAERNCHRLRRSDNSREVPIVTIGYGQRIEHVDRQYVVRNKAVLSDPPWPAASIQRKQSHIRTRHCRQGDSRRPYHV